MQIVHNAHDLIRALPSNTPYLQYQHKTFHNHHTSGWWFDYDGKRYGRRREIPAHRTKEHRHWEKATFGSQRADGTKVPQGERWTPNDGDTEIVPFVSFAAAQENATKRGIAQWKRAIPATYNSIWIPAHITPPPMTKSNGRKLAWSDPGEPCELINTTGNVCLRLAIKGGVCRRHVNARTKHAEKTKKREKVNAERRTQRQGEQKRVAAATATIEEMTPHLTRMGHAADQFKADPKAHGSVTLPAETFKAIVAVAALGWRDEFKHD